MVLVWLKRLLGLAILLLVLHFFWPVVKDLRGEQVRYKLHHAHWVWLPGIVAVAVASYCSLAWLNMLTLKPFGDHISFRDTLGMLTAVACAEVALPSAGASGVAVRARLLAKYGYSVEVSGFSLIFESVFLAIAMAAVAILGCVYILRSGILPFRMAVGVTVALLAAAAWAGALWGGWQVLFNPRRSAGIVHRCATVWNRVAGRWRPLSEELINQRAAVFQEGVRQLSVVPRWRFLAAAYGRVLLDTLTLELCFGMFGHWVHYGALLTGFGFTMVMSALAALPFGLGLADLSLPTVFFQFGVPRVTSLAAGLTYRLVAFWLPRFIGYVSWTLMESRPGRAPAAVAPAEPPAPIE